MNSLQSSTRKEIYAAKKILYEGNDKTKQTFSIALASLVYMFCNKASLMFKPDFMRFWNE